MDDELLVDKELLWKDFITLKRKWVKFDEFVDLFVIGFRRTFPAHLISGFAYPNEVFSLALIHNEENKVKEKAFEAFLKVFGPSW